MDLFTESKKIKNWWYYFLNFYFWFSIVLIVLLTTFCLIIYFKYISPNLDTLINGYNLFIEIIRKAEPLAEEYLNLTI